MVVRNLDSGRHVATEAAEAFYRSGIHLYSGLGQLLDILEHCPLSSNATPGRFITRLKLSIDEDVEYTGDDFGPSLFGGKQTGCCYMTKAMNECCDQEDHS